jgi:adenosylcobinamide-phosphate synthase
MKRSVVLVLALALDLGFGEPPAAVHPVVWFGRLTALLERRARRGSPRWEFLSGVGIVLTSLLVAWQWARGAQALLAFGSRRMARAATPLLGTRPATRLATATALLAEAWLLKTTLSLRALAEAAGSVQQALEREDLAAARTALRGLVSRDTADLPAPLLAAAAIESVAENASDALVAPALAYAAFGLSGAAIYRGINTLDATLGYHGPYEWLGKLAARLDDAANLLPARLTALLLALTAQTGRRRPAWRMAWRDHRRTASPNAGWPMSAMAGALGVELEKAGHYRLGSPARSPRAGDIGTAIRLLRRVAALTVAVVAVIRGVGNTPLQGPPEGTDR